MDRKPHALAVALFVIIASAITSAQRDVTSADIQRLQDSVTAAGKDIAAMRARDPQAARTLQNELNDIQDEVIYLKVKLRKERTLPQIEYTDLRDRLEDLRTRARGEEGAAGAYARPVPSGPPSRPEAASAGAAIPVGTEIDVRLRTPLNSDSAQIEDRFEATTLVELKRDGRVLVPAGSLVTGIVTSVKAAGRIERKGSISLSFDRITIDGVTHSIRGTLLQAIESEGIKADAGKMGAGAAIGGILGGVLGGWKGGIAGVLIGGGGTMVATEGKQVDLKPGTVLRMRFDSELPLP